MTTSHRAEFPSQQAIVDAALLMLQQVGLPLADLVTVPKDRPPATPDPPFGAVIEPAARLR